MRSYAYPLLGTSKNCCILYMEFVYDYSLGENAWIKLIAVLVFGMLLWKPIYEQRIYIYMP